MFVRALQAVRAGPEGDHPRRDVAEERSLQEQAQRQGRHELLLVAQRLADDALLDETLDALDPAHGRLAPPLDLGQIGLLDRPPASRSFSDSTFAASTASPIA